ncbi:MAG: anthranilate phosphoribosyltransferase [Gammaproteobacteria bacterium]|nr:MAG: anthranilate phosphoribosyltransferase [Gammaproteobacteria bacterium]
MQTIIEKLYQKKHLSLADSQQLFEKMLAGDLNPVVISAILMALKIKGETADEVAGLVKTIRAVAEPFPLVEGIYADCCGTGGDGFNTFNVSTASAFVAAECGLNMVKHGNRSVSSRSGSADIIEALGIDINASAEQSKACLDLNQYTFLFAPKYHPLMAQVGPVRKQLATGTIFNLAGPLANPAAPPVQLMGVNRKELCLPLAEVLLKLDCKRALVVCGSGLDEIALHSDTTAVMVDDGKIINMIIKPQDAGLDYQPLEAIQLSAEDDPLTIFQNVIAGKGSSAMTDMVSLNAGTLLWLSGQFDSIKAATNVAKQALLDGAVANRVASIKAFYHG